MKNYHDNVSDYYDQDVGLGFEERAGKNPLLDRIRKDFRAITGQYQFENALEIGCGPGFDVEWMATAYPQAQVVGIDISDEMVKLADARIQKAGLRNARVMRCDERELFRYFKEEEFDCIYVFFGALNTVQNLDETALKIDKLLKPGGHAVLTFVNKWYLREMLVHLLKLQFKGAFARIRKVWGGYSPDRFLPSMCYSPRQIKRSFKSLKIIKKRGYSIFFPAWYNYKKAMQNPARTDKLWNIDNKLQKTFLWSKGEYTLFVLKKQA